MLTTLRPYPAYKPSAVPWLGDVPEHWEVRRGRRHWFRRLYAHQQDMRSC